MNVSEKIREQWENRFSEKSMPHVKVNLFTGYELAAVEKAVSRLSHVFTHTPIDCVMVGDSLLTTHFGYDTTVLTSLDEQKLFIQAFLVTLHEVFCELKALSGKDFAPYLIADMPYGSALHVDAALKNAEKMYNFGADVVKLETYNEDVIDIVEELSGSGYLVMGHVGYTPQVGGKKSRGSNFDDAQALFALARRVRDAGAVALVVEGVATIVNEALCRKSKKGLPIYSIFSGYAKHGGQSINVWDAVFRPGFKARFFPPTASMDEVSYPKAYTEQIICEHVEKLLQLVWLEAWPNERKNDMSVEEQEILIHTDPWA